MINQCTITLKQKGDSYLQIYCYTEGQPEYTGQILLQHYNNPKKIKALLKLGNLYKIGSLLKPPKGTSHSFKEPAANVCIAYGRDRGRAKIEPTFFQGKHQFLNFRMYRNFNYLFTKDIWMVNGQLLEKILKKI